MQNLDPLSRRRAMRYALATSCLAASPIGGGFGCNVIAPRAGATDDASSLRFPLGVFTKPFNSLSYDELADGVASLKLQGVEATVRRGGNVEPDRVEEDLPRLMRALSERNLRMLVMTTDVNRADDPLNQRVLRTAADLGVTHFRMQYVRYDLDQPIRRQWDHWRKQFASLAKFCRQLNLTALYQNHAGARYMGSPIWDLDRVLQDISPAEIGVAFDIRHAAVEAGTSWPVAWRVIRPRVQAIYVKDFRWNELTAETSRPLNVPLGEGRVPRKFFEELFASDFSGPISLHEEYLDHRDPKLVPAHWRALEADLATLRRWLPSADVTQN